MSLIEFLLREGEEEPKDKKPKEEKKQTAPSINVSKLIESDAVASVLIHGRQSVAMKAFKDKREKDPAKVLGSFGVKGGRGWEGIYNAMNSLSASDGLGSVINGALIVTNGGNTDPDNPRQKVRLGIAVECADIWDKGHENSGVSKKLVAWWVKQILRGAFDQGLISDPGRNDVSQTKFARANFKRWDQKWKVYESSEGGLLIFFGSMSDWNAGAT